MLQNLTWMQILLLLTSALAVYYVWALWRLYGRKFLDNFKNVDSNSGFEWEKGNKSFFGPPSGAQEHPTPVYGGGQEFLDQLRLYLVPYRNAGDNPVIQWDTLKELLQKYNPSNDRKLQKIMVETLVVELEDFGIDISFSTIKEKIGCS
ncbi:hypothetical protein CHU00_07535 [Sphingobacterium cellulitidis]|uniref:Uncharacterized protein n=2 Tax=Sphingobacteriaceae TaxID=84566 RepID=A0A8H9FZG6_9SPHI|nr:hypothetical protein CHT99_11495 [Sphingobacterium cellulitidis]OYD46521.1 hypothetical protein CHU00_07535 [Sphingobacterium cellulitidis]GGE24203.1 hypothetical protein GCM10011516_22290 [Sphingobacterium soli]